jgi:RNA polymerase sigma-70 factor (ECF subfamily)
MNRIAPLRACAVVMRDDGTSGATRLGPPDAVAAADARDAALMARIATGERGEPLVALYRRYEGRLYGLGLRLLRDRGLAEELVQETFLRVWRGAARFDPDRGTARAYVFTIARRVAADLWRRPSSRPLEAAPDRDGIPETGDAYEALLLGIAVRDALQSLPHHHREVLELAYDHHLTQTQIAERIEIPLGTVKTRTFHALRAMKVALHERGIDA